MLEGLVIGRHSGINFGLSKKGLCQPGMERLELLLPHWKWEIIVFLPHPCINDRKHHPIKELVSVCFEK